MKVFITGAAGYIGGSVAAALARAGHQVTGLVRDAAQLDELARIGVAGVVGTLDDSALLTARAQAADAVINAASADHRGAVETLIAALAGSGKVLLHTSGSSIVGDASGGEGSEVVYREDQLPAPTADKAKRVAIDQLVIDSAAHGGAFGGAVQHADLRPRRAAARQRAVATLAQAGTQERRGASRRPRPEHLV